ncbi:MAG TPA: hypothetical protein VNB49_09270 [Candidatus Dormibacteraeota bacterium]|nr:hypothetical protein [Candidatus Dormibacteraeota bacterium]
MNEIMNWMQSNWYEFGSLLAQFGFFIAAVWFGRKILMSMRATQQQFGALLRLSMTDGLEEHSKDSEIAREPIPAPRPSVVASSMLSPALERPTAPPAAPTRSLSSYAAFERPTRSEAPSLSDELSERARTSAPITPTFVEPTDIEPAPEPTPYVAAPLTLPDEEHAGNPIVAAGRDVVRWLQTPMASGNSGSSTWRKIVRWLQAPARS